MRSNSDFNSYYIKVRVGKANCIDRRFHQELINHNVSGDNITQLLKKLVVIL